MTGLPIIIDSFAGGGGASTGIEMALGRSPDIAINHSGPALALLEGVWCEDEASDWRWQPFPKSAQISACGNSVCPDVAAALVRANCGHLMAAQWGGYALDQMENAG